MAADAPVVVFSAGRVLKQLEQISQSPHPAGSLEHGRVREHLMRELTALGLKPEVQETTALRRDSSLALRGATVRNVIAVLKGEANEQAVLLVAHYDTVANSPGTSDDGYGVATLLETMRALRSIPPLKNDVVALFTDAEEVGLLGARAFLDERPYAGEIGVVLNFEARGDRGPAIMFETSPNNNQLIGELAEAAPHLRANSVSTAIYSLLPNDTDLTEFKGAKLPGLNFANIDGFMRYHTRADSLENLDERSLQHQGLYALALARRFAGGGFATEGAGDAVYFNLLGLTFIHYPAKWVWPLTLLALALYVATVLMGLRSGRFTGGGTAVGALIFILCIVTCATVSGLMWWLVKSVQSWAGRSLQDDFYGGELYLAGFSLVCGAIAVALYGRARGRVSLEALAAGSQGGWSILLVAASLLLPGATYLLTWPLVFGSLGLAAVSSRGGVRASVAVRCAILLLCAAPGIVLMAPLVHSFFVAVGLGMIGGVAVVIGLGLGLIVPLCGLVAGFGRWHVPAGLVLAAVVLFLAAALGFNFDRRHPQANSLLYALNADTGQAVWASADALADEWTVQFLGRGAERGSITDYAPRFGGSYLKQSAPAIERKPPRIEVLEDRTENEVRTLRFNISPTQPGSSVVALVDPKAEVLSATVNGKRAAANNRSPASAPGGPWTLQYWATPAGGIELALEVKAPRPLRLLVVEQANGLPEIPGQVVRPRPDYMMPAPFVPSDVTVVRKTYTF